ncbi:hypothetical protein ABLN67_04165, partial [Mycobacterium tuberculosis]
MAVEEFFQTPHARKVYRHVNYWLLWDPSTHVQSSFNNQPFLTIHVHSRGVCVCVCVCVSVCVCVC